MIECRQVAAMLTNFDACVRISIRKKENSLIIQRLETEGADHLIRFSGLAIEVTQCTALINTRQILKLLELP